MGPRHSRWTRAAATLAGGGLLALVATWLAVSLAGTTAAIAAGQHSVQITSGTGCTNCFFFGPATVAAASGDTVTWTNGTTAYHTITRCDASACAGQGPGTGGDALSSPTLFGGGSFSHAFSAGGTYLYYCTVHGYAVMHGEVDVSGGPPPPPPPTPRPTPTPTPKPKPTPRPTPAPTQRMTTPSSAPAVAATHTPPPATATAATSGNSPSPLAITLPSGVPIISSGPSSASAFSTTPVAAAGTTSGGPPVVPMVVALIAIAGLAGAGYRLWRRRSPTA